MADRALVVPAMIPRLLAVLATILSMLTRAHLTFTLMHLTVTVAVPWAITAAFVTVLAVMAWIIWRNVHGFRSSPYARTRTAT